MHVQYAMTFSGYPIAAATIADSWQATPFCHALSYGSSNFAEPEADSMFGVPFWGAGIERWIERSPAFHLDRIHAALRIEHHGTTSIPCTWDTFAMLKRQRRPVEMIHIPRSDHMVVTPPARYLSQEGDVDWFRFWLKGEEDVDSAKAEQYRRWRRLRAEAALTRH
jgi:hypothetical protein